MKILHIITGLGNGGAESLLDAMVRYDSEHQHIVVSLHSLGHYGPSLIDDGFEVHTLDMPSSKLTLSGIRRLFKIIRSCHPDIIQTWMYHANFLGGIVGRILGHKHIVWGLHASKLDPKKVPTSMRLCNAFCAKTSRLIPKKVIHSSVNGAEYHIALGYHKNRMCVLPSGYDISQYAPSEQVKNETRAKLGISDDKFVITSIARWHPQKDHANLIQAIALLPESIKSRIIVVLVGSDITDDNPKLKQLIEINNVESIVFCIGPRRDIPAILNASDLHVLSSAFGESFPNVVNEAMATGIPGVVTDVGDSALIVGDTGWVVEPKNSDCLAQAIELAVNESETPAWQDRKIACRERVVKNYSLPAMVNGYHKVWNT